MVFVESKLVTETTIIELIASNSNCLTSFVNNFFLNRIKLKIRKIKIKTLPKSKNLCPNITKFFRNISGEARCQNPDQGDSGWVCM